MMEFIRTLKEKQQTSKQNNIVMQAQDAIYLADFDDKIYISYHGTPLIPIEDTWTQKDIIKKLKETRDSYINYEMKKLNQPKIAIML